MCRAAVLWWRKRCRNAASARNDRRLISTFHSATSHANDDEVWCFRLRGRAVRAMRAGRGTRTRFDTNANCVPGFITAIALRTEA